MPTDCLIVGHVELPAPRTERIVRSMGEGSGAYRDLALATLEHDSGPRFCMDMLNQCRGVAPGATPLHNCDFLWPTITYLGTYLHRHGFSFDYVNLPHLNGDLFAEKLRGDVLSVAITTTLYVAPHPIEELIATVRRCNRAAKIIVGGPYIYNQSRTLSAEALRELFAFLGADIYVIQQMGEAALVNVLGTLKRGGDLGAVANIAFRPPGGGGRSRAGEDGRVRLALLADARAWVQAHPEQAATVRRRSTRAGEVGAWVVTPAAAEDNPLAANRIDYGLFPDAALGEFVSLWTSRSCPYACAFCGFPERAGAYQYLPVETIEGELQTLHRRGVTHLTFIDDTLNVPRQRFKDLLRMMIRNRFGFRWNSFYRCDQGDAETVALMAEAGCAGVFLGVESGSDRMLTAMNKTARRADYVRAIPQLKAAGILTHANFVVGFPGETCASVQESIDLVEEVAPDTYRAQLWYCDPVTPVWRRREELGIEGSAFQWTHATMDHQTAADQVDRMYLGVRNSTWLPQHSFEQWSVLYLEHHGMPRPRVLRFVRLFNTGVRQKLLEGRAAALDGRIVAGLARTAAFDRCADDADETVVEEYGAPRYGAAEAVALARFADGGAAPWSAAPAAAAARAVVRRRREAPMAWGPETPARALTAWWTVVQLAQPGAIGTVVVATPAGVVPVRLGPLPAAAAAAVAMVAREVAASAQHARFLLPIVANPWRMAQRGGERPALQVACVLRPAGRAVASLEALLERWPALATDLCLGLELTEHVAGCEAQLTFRPDLLPPARVEALADTLMTLLAAPDPPTLAEPMLFSAAAALGRGPADHAHTRTPPG